MKLKMFGLVALLSVSTSTLVGCGCSMMGKKYTVEWQNYDGTLLQKETYRKGQLPSYKGSKPLRDTDDYLYYYDFSGWDKK